MSTHTVDLGNLMSSPFARFTPMIAADARLPQTRAIRRGLHADRARGRLAMRERCSRTATVALRRARVTQAGGRPEPRDGRLRRLSRAHVLGILFRPVPVPRPQLSPGRRAARGTAR